MDGGASELGGAPLRLAPARARRGGARRARRDDRGARVCSAWVGARRRLARRARRLASAGRGTPARRRDGGGRQLAAVLRPLLSALQPALAGERAGGSPAAPPKPKSKPKPKPPKPAPTSSGESVATVEVVTSVVDDDGDDDGDGAAADTFVVEAVETDSSSESDDEGATPRSAAAAPAAAGTAAPMVGGVPSEAFGVKLLTSTRNVTGYRGVKRKGGGYILAENVEAGTFATAVEAAVAYAKGRAERRAARPATAAKAGGVVAAGTRWLSPSGEEHAVAAGEMVSFCRQRGLSEREMRRVRAGQAAHHKGWRCCADEGAPTRPPAAAPVGAAAALAAAALAAGGSAADVAAVASAAVTAAADEFGEVDVDDSDERLPRAGEMLEVEVDEAGELCGDGARRLSWRPAEVLRRLRGNRFVAKIDGDDEFIETYALHEEGDEWRRPATAAAAATAAEGDSSTSPTSSVVADPPPTSPVADRTAMNAAAAARKRAASEAAAAQANRRRPQAGGRGGCRRRRRRRPRRRRRRWQRRRRGRGRAPEDAADGRPAREAAVVPQGARGEAGGARGERGGCMARGQWRARRHRWRG